MALEARWEVVADLVDKAGLSVRRFAELAGIKDHQKLDNWLKGKNKPRDESVWESLEKLAQNEYQKVHGVKRTAAIPMRPLRVVGLVAAGEGVYNVDTEYGQVMVPANLAADDNLGWEVEGDSMMPALEPGDIAVFKEFRQPRTKLAYLIKTGDGLKCKKLRWDQFSSRWEMESLNPNYPTEPLEDAELLGFCVGYYRVRGLHEKFEGNPEGLRLD